LLSGPGIEQMRLIYKTSSSVEPELISLSHKDLVLPKTNQRLLAKTLIIGQEYTLEIHFIDQGMVKSLICQQYSLEIV
jgi:hypothetical protein